MAGLQLSGLASGLDTQGIITQLMAVERAPRTKITYEQAATTKRQSILQDLGSKLTSLKLASDALKSTATWTDTQTVTSADPAKVAAARTGGAPPGEFKVSVSQLASAERRTYAWAPPAAAGPLTIYNPPDPAAPAAPLVARAHVDLAAGATVDDAVAAINSNKDANLFAVNVNGDLVLASRTTGTAGGFSAGGAGVGAQLEADAGKDAKFAITTAGGTTTNYTKASNLVTDALGGVQLTLKAVTAGTDTVGLSVGGPGPDKDAIVGKAKAFVDAYNALVTASRGALDEKRVVKPAKSGDAEQGTLFGDTGLSEMLSAFRIAVADKVGGTAGPDPQYLADIGISTGAANTGATINQDAVDGKLTLDTAKLTSLLDSNPLGVRKLLGGLTGGGGFGAAFAGVIAPFQGTGGVLDERVTSAGKDLTRIKDKLDAFDSRMTAKQSRYQKQFTALETAMQKSQAVGNSLTGYINSLSAR